MRALWIPAVVLLMSLPSAGCVKKSLYEAAVQSLTESQSRVASQEERIAALERELGELEAALRASRAEQTRLDGELSAARAISVVQFLIEAGVPANRLAAAGFGEHQPIDPADNIFAYSRNRRIEMRLTQR